MLTNLKLERQSVAKLAQDSASDEKDLKSDKSTNNAMPTRLALGVLIQADTRSNFLIVSNQVEVGKKR